MNTIKNLGSTGIYAYTTLISGEEQWDEGGFYLHRYADVSGRMQFPDSTLLLSSYQHQHAPAPSPPPLAVFICVPGIFFFEPGVWAAMKAQVAAQGASQFYGSLVSVGLLYHLYNQVGGVGWDGMGWDGWTAMELAGHHVFGLTLWSGVQGGKPSRAHAHPVHPCTPSFPARSLPSTRSSG
jgi:hypothetical protein